MARTDFTLRNSALIQVDDVADTTEAHDFFLCNDLVEKNKFIYFKRGPLGTPNFECGNERMRMSKDGLIWSINGQCQNGLTIWKVEFQ